MATNYIQRLQEEIAALKAQNAATVEAINNQLAFLHSSKFVGEEGGERKDWIATGDIIPVLIEIRNGLTTN